MFRSLAPLSVALAFLAGCATTAAPTNVADTASRTPQLSTLSKLIADAGLTETLRGAGPYTVFAPSDDAFKAVPAKTMAELAANKDLLQSVLTYHVVAGKIGLQSEGGEIHFRNIQITRLGEGRAKP